MASGPELGGLTILTELGHNDGLNRSPSTFAIQRETCRLGAWVGCLQGKSGVRLSCRAALTRLVYGNFHKGFLHLHQPPPPAFACPTPHGNDFLNVMGASQSALMEISTNNVLITARTMDTEGTRFNLHGSYMCLFALICLKSKYKSPMDGAGWILRTPASLHPASFSHIRTSQCESHLFRSLH